MYQLYQLFSKCSNIFYAKTFFADQGFAATSANSTPAHCAATSLLPKEAI